MSWLGLGGGGDVWAGRGGRVVDCWGDSAAATHLLWWAPGDQPGLPLPLQPTNLPCPSPHSQGVSVDIAGSLARRSIDNSALTRQVAPAGGVAENYLAAAAAALAGGQAVGGLGAGGVGAAPVTGSLPSQSFLRAAAALAARGGSGPLQAAAAGQPSSPTVVEDDRALSLEQ